MHAGWSDGKPKAHSAVDLHSSLDTGSHESGPLHIGIPDLVESSTQGQTEAEPDADKENSFHLPEVTYDVEDNGHLSDDSSEEAAAQDPPEQEEECEDDEDGEESEGQSLFVCVWFFLFKQNQNKSKTCCFVFQILQRSPARLQHLSERKGIFFTAILSPHLLFLKMFKPGKSHFLLR